MTKYISKVAIFGYKVGTSIGMPIYTHLQPTFNYRLMNLHEISWRDMFYDGSELEYTSTVVYSSQLSRKRNLENIASYLSRSDVKSRKEFLTLHASDLSAILGRKGFSKLCRRYGTSAKKVSGTR